MISADQLIAHAVGDYLLQSDWMATEKTKKSTAALAHVFMYALPFTFLHPSAAALAVIVASHFVIDRWRLARFVVWAKNWLAPWKGRVIDGPPEAGPRKHVWDPPNKPWSVCSATGYDPERPAWLTVWLLIIADNVMHVLINGAALRWL